MGRPGRAVLQFTRTTAGAIQTIATIGDYGQYEDMHALKKIAEWVLGIPEADPGQGTAWRYAQNFPWPSWLLLIFSVAAAILVVLVYRRDAALLSRRSRACLAG